MAADYNDSVYEKHQKDYMVNRYKAWKKLTQDYPSIKYASTVLERLDWMTTGLIEDASASLPYDELKKIIDACIKLCPSCQEQYNKLAILIELGKIGALDMSKILAS